MIRIVYELTPSEPAVGIALEEALLESARLEGRDTLRLWVNARAVVIGRSQAMTAEVDLEEAERSGIPVLRRISGGGAVYHHPGNFNISLYISDGRRLGGVAEVFRRVGEAVADGLSGHGIEIEPTGNRFLAKGRKVGGAAQARRGAALLYHTTLLVRPDSIPMESLLRAMRPGYRTPAVTSHPFPTASLSEIIGTELALEEVAAAAAGGIARAWGESLTPGKVSEEERTRAEELVREKYGTDRWNRQR